ncbi:UNVERIFIED_CONTAM: hypothetical protein K2H54_043252 [Gekko kuhli]
MALFTSGSGLAGQAAGLELHHCYPPGGGNVTRQGPVNSPTDPGSGSGVAPQAAARSRNNIGLLTEAAAAHGPAPQTPPTHPMAHSLAVELLATPLAGPATALPPADTTGTSGGPDPPGHRRR